VGKKAIRNYVYNGYYTPAAVGSGETVALLTVQPGDRVVAASVRMKIAAAASTTSTISIGDGTSVQGYVANIDTETTAANTLVDGQGALFNQGGKLYTVADTIDAVYTTGATPGAVNPALEWRITIRKAEW
jgi:hypothetical protein